MAPVTRTTSVGSIAWVSLSKATPSASWSVTVSRYVPGAVGAVTGSDRPDVRTLTGCGATTSPGRSATTRSTDSGGGRGGSGVGATSLGCGVEASGDGLASGDALASGEGSADGLVPGSA